MINASSKYARIGILGGGQLALMLADACQSLGLTPIILAENKEAPAALVYPNGVFGSAEEPEVLRRLFSQVGQVIFENEFVNCERLAEVASPSKIKFFPDLKVILALQDKLKQKQILEKLNIPIADYVLIDSKQELKSQLLTLLEKFQGTCVLKWARMGYDGKGVLVLTSSPDSISKASQFITQAAVCHESPVYAERKINFLRELAIIGIRSTRGEFQTYPLVISEQEDGVCSRVFGPARLFGASKQQEFLAQDYACKLAQATDLVGAFAVEFFETREGGLLVNEIAPRVHNSGHYTQDGCQTSQFVNHLRAVLGMPLGEIGCRAGFGMINLLGPNHLIRNDYNPSFQKSPSGVFFHWYGKKEIRPRRKLGHLNGVVNSSVEVVALMKKLEECHKTWLLSLEEAEKDKKNE